MDAQKFEKVLQPIWPEIQDRVCWSSFVTQDRITDAPYQRHIFKLRKRFRVLPGAEKIMGPFPDWAMSGFRTNQKDHGRVCSRLYGLTKNTNQIESMCKVCFTKEYTMENWPETVTQLIAGDLIKIESVLSGGSDALAENYGCHFDKDSKVDCRSDNFNIIGKSSKSNENVQIMCTSNHEMNESEFKLIFKDIFELEKN
ncbi:MAG: hypothetical protein A4S09_17145 [Proteobacteria bacterium SG_bin7]|nr:MAG: hypothetical protein A4S09_17145 [Proteobacteria bacterium SG_bin7]